MTKPSDEGLQVMKGFIDELKQKQQDREVSNTLVFATVLEVAENLYSSFFQTAELSWWDRQDSCWYCILTCPDCGGEVYLVQIPAVHQIKDTVLCPYCSGLSRVPEKESENE